PRLATSDRFHDLPPGVDDRTQSGSLAFSSSIFTKVSAPRDRGGGRSLTQMTPKAASEQVKATTGPNVHSHTMASPTRHSPSTATALRLDMCPRHARQAQYATHGTMASRIAIQANLVGPSLKAPDTSRIIAS